MIFEDGEGIVVHRLDVLLLVFELRRLLELALSKMHDNLLYFEKRGLSLCLSVGFQGN